MKTGDTGRVLELTTCFAGLAIWSWRTSRHLGTVQPYGGRKCTTEEECKPPFCRPNMTTFTMTETNEWENEKWRGQKCPSNGIKSCPSPQFVFIGTDLFLYISLRLSFLSCISCLIKHFNKRALINLFSSIVPHVSHWIQPSPRYHQWHCNSGLLSFDILKAFLFLPLFRTWKE